MKHASLIASAALADFCFAGRSGCRLEALSGRQLVEQRLRLLQIERVEALGAGADNAFHAAQFIFNSASSIFYVDGTQTTGANLGNSTAFPASAVDICNSSANSALQKLTGFVAEVGIWSRGFTTPSNRQ
jgi:hypothetical protein